MFFAISCLHNLENVTHIPAAFRTLSPNWKVPGIFIFPVFQSSSSMYLLMILLATQIPELSGRQNVRAPKFCTVGKSCFLICSQGSTEIVLALFWKNLPSTTSKKFMSWACQSSPPPLTSLFSSPSYCTLTVSQAKSTMLSRFSATPPFSKPPFPAVDRHRTLQALVCWTHHPAERATEKIREICTTASACSYQETSAFVMLLRAGVTICIT